MYVQNKTIKKNDWSTLNIDENNIKKEIVDTKLFTTLRRIWIFPNQPPPKKKNPILSLFCLPIRTRHTQSRRIRVFLHGISAAVDTDRLWQITENAKAITDYFGCYEKGLKTEMNSTFVSLSGVYIYIYRVHLYCNNNNDIPHYRRRNRNRLWIVSPVLAPS